MAIKREFKKRTTYFLYNNILRIREPNPLIRFNIVRPIANWSPLRVVDEL